MAKIIYLKDGQFDKAQLHIDGVHIDKSDWDVDSKIHAIQWDGSKGQIEYNDGTPNKEITDISSFNFETKHSTEKKSIDDAKAKADKEAEEKMTYADKRALEYPAIGDQLDDIYHNGIDGWKSTIKAVKDKYPK